MASKAGTIPSVVVQLTLKEPKKNSVRYDATEADSPVRSLYLANASAEELGTPEAITLTIEAS